MNYINQKQSILHNHLILLKNYYIRKKLSDIKHVNLYKEWKHFIEAIIYQKKIHIKNYSYTVQIFFNISNEEMIDIKKIDLHFLNKIINQETYSDSIKFIQNHSQEIKIFEELITNIFSNIFRRLII